MTFEISISALTTILLMGPTMAYPEYVFLTLAAGMMLFTSFQIHRIYKKAKALGLTTHE